MSFTIPECLAPLPTTIPEIKKEIEFLQKEIRHWNSLLIDPKSDKNTTLREWDGEDDGISVILEGRRMLIKMRETWANYRFKHFNKSKPLEMSLKDLL